MEVSGAKVELRINSANLSKVEARSILSTRRENSCAIVAAFENSSCHQWRRAGDLTNSALWRHNGLTEVILVKQQSQINGTSQLAIQGEAIAMPPTDKRHRYDSCALVTLEVIKVQMVHRWCSNQATRFMFLNVSRCSKQNFNGKLCYINLSFKFAQSAIYLLSNNNNCWQCRGYPEIIHPIKVHHLNSHHHRQQIGRNWSDALSTLPG